MLHQVGTSHCLVAPAQPLPKFDEGRTLSARNQIRATHSERDCLVASADYVPAARCGKVWCVRRVSDLQLQSGTRSKGNDNVGISGTQRGVGALRTDVRAGTRA